MQTEQLWIQWIRELQAISQNGLVYTVNPFDRERYERLGQLAREMFAHIGYVPVKKIEEFFVPDEGYCTPKVDLRAGIFDEDRVLLVQEKSDGRWTMPGGWADVNETPSQGVKREVLEESGYFVDEVELVAVIDRSAHPYTPRYPHHVYKLFFYAKPSGKAESRQEHETADARFFEVSDLPELSEARVLRQDIERLFDYHQNRGPVHTD
jgi:ADP-ribose pyrophosphatase YjhB (NUDIX family)